jgi:hypothetical protein
MLLYHRVDFALLFLVGLLAGLHSACWGAFKDSAYEGFGFFKFARGIFFGMLSALGSFILLSVMNINSLNLGVFFGFAVLAERALTEFIKAYVRTEPQEKYMIPSRVQLLGRVVKKGINRIVIGFVFTMSFILFSLFVLSMKELSILRWPFNGIFFGFLGGFLMALGGCLKDAPFEGFSLLKFTRSPLIGLLAGILLSSLAANYGVIMLSSMGVERMATEAYKTFIKKGVPGKFKAEKPLHKEWIAKRSIFIYPYLATWLAFLFSFSFSIVLY